MTEAQAVRAGTFVLAAIAGRRVLCLKAERIGKDHVNHYLVPLDPVADRAATALVYIDPTEPVEPVDGVSFAITDGPEDGVPQPGDMFLAEAGTLLKVIDDPQAQRLHAYVDLATGLLRPRMERGIRRLLCWELARV